VDTSSYTVNDELWINGSGTLQNTRPTSGLIQKIGRVVRVHATTGEILVLGAGRTNDVPFPLYVDHTNQRVGIGTTSPTKPLHVYSATIDQPAIFESGDSRGGIEVKDSDTTSSVLIGAVGDDLRVYAGGGDKFTVKSDGKVGIGTTSPGQALVVKGRISADHTGNAFPLSVNSDQSTSGIILTDAGTTSNVVLRSNGNDFQIRTNGANRVTVDSSGNVGIGRTDPDTVLHVNGAVTISSDTGVGNTHFPFTDGRFYYTADPETGGTGDHVFRHYSGGSYVEQMRILEGGKVGIGTNSPVAGLDISTTAGDTWTSNGWDSGIILNAASVLRWREAGGVNYGIGNSGGTLYFMSSTSSTTGAAADYRMVINSSGQVGIGTTDPTAGYELDVIGDGRFSSSVYAQLHNSNSNQSRDKLRVWNSGTYSIGMKSGYKFGYLGGTGTGSDYAMSFQMSNSANRGFWWGDTGHSDSQGAMSLTTQGQLYVATRIHVGGGESRTDPSTGYNLVNSGTTYLYGNVVLGTLPGVSGYYTVRRRNSDGLLGYASSSQRYKENVADADEHWRNIYNLRPVTFDWREFMFETEPDGVPDDRSDFGLIAEEVAVHLPEVVTYQVIEGEGDDPVPDAVDYEKLSVFYLSALQDLEARVAALEN
jgi:hypothetical protein